MSVATLMEMCLGDLAFSNDLASLESSAIPALWLGDNEGLFCGFVPARLSHQSDAERVTQIFRCATAEAGRYGVEVNPSLSMASLAERISNARKNADLVAVFTCLYNAISPAQPLIELPAELEAKAAAIRVWMTAHQDALRTITCLDLREKNIRYLPEEISLLANLQRLILSENPVAALPAAFNPPALEVLDLSHTPVAALSAGFNPPALRSLNLSHTPVAALQTDPEN